MDLERLRTWLTDARTPTGAWGYGPGAEPAAEPTLMAVAAGLPAPLDWLDRDLGWAETLVPAAVAPGDGDARRERAVAAILAAKGEAIEDNTSGTFDGKLIGWSWVPGTFSWVEPTSWAIVGLCAAGHGGHARVNQGREVLLDRACADGGYNFGSPDALGQDLPSYPHSTAIALLALPSGDVANRALDRLAAHLTERSSAYALALAVLAGLRHGRDVAPWLAALGARQRADGALTGRVHVDALAAIAGAGAPHPFLGVPLA